MDVQQIATTRAHLMLIRSRISSLQAELKVALRDKDEVDREEEDLKARMSQMKEAVEQQRIELENEFNQQMIEHRKQLSLNDEVLEKKREERKTLLKYLQESQICDFVQYNIGQIDWPSMKALILSKLEESPLKDKIEQGNQLNELVKIAVPRRAELYELFTSTLQSKSRALTKLKEVKDSIDDWRSLVEAQEAKISKLKGDNERLDLLIKQCASTNEPMSEFMARNVQAKCHSFVESDNRDELLEGLQKFKSRQARILKLLQHKERILSRDTNQLKIAKDQTADQMQFYGDMIKTRNNQNLLIDLKDS